MIKTWRSSITSRLSEPWVIPARKAARTVDILAGLPLSPWRLGSVALYHISRCGSTVLGNLLDQHPKMYWDGEIFFRKREFDHYTCPPFDLKKYLEREMLVAGNRFYGFEMKIHPGQQLPVVHTDLSGFVQQLIEMGISHHIILKRKNYLRVIVSKEVAKQTKQWHVSRETSTPSKLYLDPTAMSFGFHGQSKPLIDCLDEMDEAYRQLDVMLADQQMLYLTYEDDIADNPVRAYQRCCNFLGLEPVDVSVQIRKTNPFKLADLLENYAELQRLLNDTPYAWMLEQ